HPTPCRRAGEPYHATATADRIPPIATAVPSEVRSPCGAAHELHSPRPSAAVAPARGGTGAPGRPGLRTYGRVAAGTLTVSRKSHKDIRAIGGSANLCSWAMTSRAGEPQVQRASSGQQGALDRPSKVILRAFESVNCYY
uniref:Uncharacterized protein n=1 Tax=Aegilops tauschii subsp. strangulata TaxID=200361 RepID=A0A453SQP2_AEGTS